MIDELFYKKSLDEEKSPLEAKLLYLTLLEFDILRFRELKQKCFMAANTKVYANLRFLAKQGLIHPHPLLTSEEPPTKPEMRQAGSLYIQVLDRSNKALLWALGNFATIYELESRSESQCTKELKLMAEKERHSIISNYRMHFHFQTLKDYYEAKIC